MSWKLFHFQRQVLRFNPLVNLLHLTKMSFYAVAKGRTSGIYMNWADCEAQVKGFSGARYKKFSSVIEAQEFIERNSSSNAPTKSVAPKIQQAPKRASTVPNKMDNGTLKRAFSTSSKNIKEDIPKKKSRAKEKKENISNDDLDLTTVVVKQLDDIEARLKGVTKSVDNIIKKNTKSVGKKSILLEPQYKSHSFQVDGEGFVQVYTDGACSSNGRTGARAGLGVFWGEGHSLNISEPVSGRATNNCGEIQAATRAIQQAIDNGIDKLAINTDSKFLINSVTKWMAGWKRRGWKLQSGESVKNEIDFKELDSLQNKIAIKWNYVEAHKGIQGNEMADQLAKAGAAKYGSV